MLAPASRLQYTRGLEMPDSLGGLTRTAASLHRGMKDIADPVGSVLVDGFHYLALFAIGATTVWSAGAAFLGMVGRGRAELSDILLLFIYLELGAMVSIYFKTTRMPVRYLIYIAITALARVLIEIVGAEHRTGTDLLIVTGAILLLSLPCWCCGSPRTGFRPTSPAPSQAMNDRRGGVLRLRSWTRTRKSSFRPRSWAAPLP